MKGTLRIAALIAVVCVAGECASAQSMPKQPPSPANLELTAEVAATTDDGYPSALRVTIKNVGNVAVDMPMLAPVCADAGVKVWVTWTANNASPFTRSWAGSCGSSSAPIVQQIEEHWVRLRPGEFMTTSLSLRDDIRGLGPGIVEYWAVYFPPRVNPKDAADVLQAGYIIPAKILSTEHQTFTLR